MSLFDSAPMQGSLKNPNELREAFLFEYLKNTGKDNITKFIKSEEAKIMIESGMIDHDLLERLSHDVDYDDRDVKLTICHMAKENDDPRVQELFAARAKEREIFDDLVKDYGALATGKVGIYKEEFINKGLPRSFKK